jgi:hypothetical protein
MTLIDRSPVGSSASNTFRWISFVDRGFRNAKPREIDALGSVETIIQPIDKYGIHNFAHDDFPRFCELVELLSPRDAEIMYLFGVLQKRPTDLSILFGKAGHRAEEDLHKAAHKLAGLIEFGPLPDIGHIDRILQHSELSRFHSHSLAACLWQYARERDFDSIQRLIGCRGLRQEMLRAFKKLHATEGREEGLLAGWILWLVDGSNPHGKGWRKRKRTGREHKLGPTVFRDNSARDANDVSHPGRTRRRESRAGKGGRGQNPCVVKITRTMKFLLRGSNAG